jgi:CMP-N,N'-diacetyllegionaminic acid synthase
MKTIALIPARAGSKRVKDKNIRSLAGHPLLAYTIRAAVDSCMFDTIVCVTDSQRYADIAAYYGAAVPCLRPKSTAEDTSPDIEWVEWILDFYQKKGCRFDIFSILRPTSPFRKPETIQRAFYQFRSLRTVDSLRAVEKCKQHPGKMWVIRKDIMHPLMPLSPPAQPWHSSQYASLPEVYVQNASLEVAWTRVVFEERTIAGQVITPFLTTEEEGLDINDEFDWWLAAYQIKEERYKLPDIQKSPWSIEQ